MNAVIDNMLNTAAITRECARLRSRLGALPHDTGLVTADDAVIHYRRFGTGEPVLLLHGGFMFIEVWSAQVRCLAEDRIVIAIDSRGHGRSTLGHKPLTYERMADDAARVLTALVDGAAHVIGWSDGGVTALALALERPELVRSITLLGTPYSTDNYGPEGWRRIDALLRDGSPGLAAMRALRGMMSPEPERWGEFLESMRRMWNEKPEYTLEDLGRITVPALVIGCDSDEFLSRGDDPLGVFTRTAEAIPRAELKVIEGGTHSVIYRRPGQVNEAVLSFLSGLSPSLR